MKRFPQKDPVEVLDYAISFDAEWDVTNDTTLSCVVEVLDETDPPLVVEETGVRDGNMAFFWLSGGLVGQDYRLNVTITTTLGRVYNAVYLIMVKDK